MGAGTQARTMTTKEHEQTEVTLAQVDGRIIMVLTSADAGSLGVSMTPRETDMLAGRLRKAASDARSAMARQRAAT